MSLNEFIQSITSHGSTSNLTYQNLSAFLTQPNKNFVAHQVKSGAEYEISKKADGSEKKVEFMLQIDPATGQSTKIYVRTIEDPGKGSKQDKGLEFGIPGDLLSTNDPLLANKVAIQYAKMMAELILQYHNDGEAIHIHTSNDFKWRDLSDMKLKESFLNRSDELVARKITVYLDNELVFSPQEVSNKRSSSNNHLKNLEKKPSLLFKSQKGNSESTFEMLLKRAEEMKLNPEIYLKSQGINPEHPDNIEMLCNLVNQDNKAALEVLKSVIENKNNASPLAQKLLAQTKNIKLSQSND